VKARGLIREVEDLLVNYFKAGELYPGGIFEGFNFKD
jgi:hypothetical protein